MTYNVSSGMLSLYTTTDMQLWVAFKAYCMEETG